MKFIAAIALALLVAQIARAQDLTVVNADGDRLSVIVDLPAGGGRVPAIVLAPGQGYHMALPALEQTARSLAAHGVAVFRFNWAYFTAQPVGRPSADLSREVGDLQAVVAAARAHPRVAAENLSVGGKSLGSIVAWRVLAADPGLRSGLFLTPICSRVPKGESVPRSEASVNYPGFAAERRPTLWIAGDQDPLCAPGMLYAFASTGAPAARVAIVGGDHGYENRALPPAAAATALKGNLSAVSVLSATFVAEAASMER